MASDAVHSAQTKTYDELSALGQAAAFGSCTLLALHTVSGASASLMQNCSMKHEGYVRKRACHSLTECHREPTPLPYKKHT